MSRFLLLLLCLLPITSEAGGSYTELEQAVFQELNQARTEPSHHVQYLDAFKASFKGSYYYKSGSPIRYVTREGVAAVDEAINFLRRQPPLPPLQWAPGLAEAARELATEQGQTGEFGHGQGTSGMVNRIERHGNWSVGYAENVSYGDYRSDSARDIVIQLIVDDGIPGRGHRNNIFTEDYRLAGVACGPHPRQKTVCVIDFAGGLAEAGEGH